MTLVFEYDDDTSKVIEVDNVMLGHFGFTYFKDGENVFVNFSDYKYCSVKE